MSCTDGMSRNTDFRSSYAKLSEELFIEKLRVYLLTKKRLDSETANDIIKYVKRNLNE